MQGISYWIYIYRLKMDISDKNYFKKLITTYKYRELAASLFVFSLGKVRHVIDRLINKQRYANCQKTWMPWYNSPKTRKEFIVCWGRSVTVLLSDNLNKSLKTSAHLFAKTDTSIFNTNKIGT